MKPETTITEAEFIERFAAEMVRVAGPRFDDGDSIEDYARETAPSYFEEQYAHEPDSTPEEWARCDISYWEA